jgi:uncharacterized protein YjeT (DUF2065 family)
MIYRADQKKEPEFMKFFLCVVGMVMIVEGLPYFAFPDRMKEMIQVIAGQESLKLRRFGFFLMLTGLGVVYLTMKAN